MVLPHLRASGKRQIGLLVGVHERQTDVMLGVDFVFLAAAQIGDEPDEARFTFRPRFDRPCAQSTGRMRGEHAHADAFDDVPDAGEVSFVCHGRATRRRPGLFPRPGMTKLHLPLDQRALDLGNGLGRVEVLRAGLGAVHDGVAAVEAERVFEIVEPLAGRLVARIDEPALRLK